MNFAFSSPADSALDHPSSTRRQNTKRTRSFFPAVSIPRASYYVDAGEFRLAIHVSHFVAEVAVGFHSDGVILLTDLLFITQR